MSMHQEIAKRIGKPTNSELRKIAEQLLKEKCGFTEKEITCCLSCKFCEKGYEGEHYCNLYVDTGNSLQMPMVEYYNVCNAWEKR